LNIHSPILIEGGTPLKPSHSSYFKVLLLLFPY